MSMFKSEMLQLSVLARIVATRGHQIVREIDKPSGHCGNVNFGLDAGGAFIELNGQRMSEDDTYTLIANLFNALEQADACSWRQEHFRDRTNDPPEEANT